MKSAYELAMERLQKQAPTISLSDAQKAAIAEVDNQFRAKIAEREVFLRDQIVKAPPQEVEAIEQQLVRELARLRSECDERKERVRSGRD